MRDDFGEIAEEKMPSEEQIPPSPLTELPKAEPKRGTSFSTGIPQILSDIWRVLRRFFKKDSMPNLVLVMVLITSITAAGLGLVNAVTVDVIEENKGDALNDALNAVFPGRELVFTEISENVYQGRDGAGELAGFGVMVAADGFAGKDSIEMIVGIDARMQVTRVEVVSQRETTGFSNASVREEFLNQFNGQNGTFSVGDQIDAIAGATVSSEAVAQGVNEAFALLEQEGTE